MNRKSYLDDLTKLITTGFIPAGYRITQSIEVDPVPENANYSALTFGLNEHNIVFRKAKVTPDRPGAFLAIWQRPSPDHITNASNKESSANIESDNTKNSTKPIPLTGTQLDYLFIQVHSHPVNSASPGKSTDNPDAQLVNKLEHGIFIFPVSLLIKKGIICGDKSKGKNGFRVFPPWSQDRGNVGTQVFSDSGKKTQRWQLPYFVSIDENGVIDSDKLKTLISQ